MTISDIFAGRQQGIIAIDGRCGSGKTYLASVLSERYDANVFHMDDFYLPVDRRAPDWKSIPAANMDLTRFEQEVLRPVQSGFDVSTKIYSCRQKAYSDLKVSYKPLTIVEGSYSCHDQLYRYYDAMVFLDISSELQLRRLSKRNNFRDFTDTWIPLEEMYFSRYHIPEKADLILKADVIAKQEEYYEKN